MAVSMLTACDTASNNEDDNQGEDNIVVPVDDSLAAAVNSELSTAVKNTLPITADANLEAALKKVSDKIDTDHLNNNAFITSSDTEDVRHRLYQEKVQGAESLEEVAARMAEAFDEYVQQYDGDILVVSHGAAITALLKRLDPQLQRMHVHLNNASFSLLEWKDGAFTVINYNLDAAYLNGGEDDDE